MAKAKRHPITPISAAARAVALGVGFTAGALGAVGAYQLQCKLEGGEVSYLVLAAPVVAVAAALIPYLAESVWRARQRMKAIALAFVLIPAAAVVFFGAAERVHMTKAGAEAERLAAHAAVTRAESDLAEVKAAAKTATAAADKVRGISEKACGPRCQSTRASEAAAQARVVEAEAAMVNAQGKAIAEAALKAPVWLLPAALDLVAFVSIWCGLAPRAQAMGRKRSKRKAKKAKPSLRLVAANEN